MGTTTSVAAPNPTLSWLSHATRRHSIECALTLSLSSSFPIALSSSTTSSTATGPRTTTVLVGGSLSSVHVVRHVRLFGGHHLLALVKVG